MVDILIGDKYLSVQLPKLVRKKKIFDHFCKF
jgi:hypothetical protein